MTHRRTSQAPAPSSDTPADPPVKRSGVNKPLGAVVVAVLLALYAWAQPLLNAQLGWNLPPLKPTVAAEADPVRQPTPTSPAVTVPAPRAEPTSTTSATTASATTAPQSASDSSELKHGLLQHQGNERYLSPAGLLYVRGSAEGHRLKHLERHTVDDPGRPGRHGVFDGGMEGALVTIDKAYRKAKAGTQTTKEEERGRVIYTVDLGSRVGFIGGQEGRRRRNPMARRVRLVLEDNRVITAFPL